MEENRLTNQEEGTPIPEEKVTSAQYEELLAVQEEEEGLRLFEEEQEESPRLLPKRQQVSRALITQSHVIQRSLFEALESPRPNQDGEIIYSNLPSVISEYDFRAYILAAQLALYDQSYKHHNEDINSGFMRDESNLSAEKDIALRDEKGEKYYAGNIKVTLNDLCRVGYGLPEGQAPTSKQRNSMRDAILALDNTPIGVTYGNGDQRTTYLIKVMERLIRKKDGAETYHLVLNPIFTTRGKGYGIIMRGATERITKYISSKGRKGTAGKSAAHLAFLQLLSIQKRGDVWRISVENLLQRLNLYEAYKKNKSRTLQKVEKLFDDFVGLGYLLEMPVIDNGVYKFKLNSNSKLEEEE